MGWSGKHDDAAFFVTDRMMLAPVIRIPAHFAPATDRIVSLVQKS
ncbi:hypothetical protein EPIR_1759 [Erwinia piriflorinigrans CFBP 5888]|uniref:Uncharacterized protein n=1 Tax=Erwinia piriflorinigrans CFBP 5888 TaxID=1161919 RepID=V5Z7A0_9GAMM|nr:hypothetical protein EPIR_1759 [Erwinia piriflorinigrans CFBP 5888]